MRTIAFFNNKGGVGKTTLVYHLASIIAARGERVLAVDLDPQANLTSFFLSEERLQRLWEDDRHADTMYGALLPIVKGLGDVALPHVEEVADNLGLIVGDLALSSFEDRLSAAWPQCHNGDESAFRVMTAFSRGIAGAAQSFEAEWIIIDVGPNLGAINRAALLASENVIFPLGADLFSLQGLQNLGPTLRVWRKTWHELRGKNPDATMRMPSGTIDPLGYVIMQPGIRNDRPAKAYQYWISRIPETFHRYVLDESTEQHLTPETDPFRIGTLRHYRSLMPMAMEARKPIFDLKPSDGAIGAHGEAVRRAKDDFFALADEIRRRTKAPAP